MQDQSRLLHSASHVGDLLTVITLVENGVDVDAKAPLESNSDGETSLLVAARNEHKDIVEFLIDEGANINCCDSNNCTVLQYASENGWLKIVQALLKKGADIDTMNGVGDTPLLLAAENGNKGIVKLLINAGADVNCSGFRYRGPTVIQHASQNGWLDVVKALLKKGADIDTMNGVGDTPLLLAAENGNKGIVELLINAGADINCSGHRNWTLLQHASSNGWLDIVQALLKKGADIHSKNADGDTPLHLAAENENESIVKLLINEGADINCSGWRKCTVLHYASGNGWLEIVQALLKKGADVNTESNDGKSPLSLINWKSPDFKLIRLLIESGAYLKTADYERISNSALLKKGILQDVELCSQSIVNEFNHKKLPELYKLCRSCENIPRIENMRVGNGSQVTYEVLQSVKREVQLEGYCNVLEACPIALKILSVKSFLSYCDNMKIWDDASKTLKR